MVFFKIVLYFHIIAGATGLLLGSIVLIRKKGDKLHKNLGKIFTVAMISTGFLAFILSYLHPNLFLFIVGVFSIYLTSTGYRMIALKNISAGTRPKSIDFVLTTLMLIACFTFLYIGTANLIAGNNFGLVLCLFGFISMRLCYSDYKLYTNKTTDKLHCLKNHIGRMTGGYIAAFTAFLVVNNTLLPSVLAWSLPTVMGLFFIFRTLRKLNHNLLKF